MSLEYWHKQTATKPLYPDIEWSKPERQQQRGKLGIIGGNKLGFISVAEAYETSLGTGVGEVKVLLPEALRKTIPPTMTDVIFGKTNPSGGLAAMALTEMKAIGEWADGILMIGDTGHNSETAILYENFLHEYDGPLTITRDAIDLLRSDGQTLAKRPNTLLVMSFAQLRKLFQAVYYPIVLTFSMQLTNLVEALHKFTVTYPVTIAVLHQDNIIIASGGEVTTMPNYDPMRIWRGETATNMSTYWIWNPSRTLESATASLVQ